MDSEVELSRRDSILTVMLTRPGKRNAMTSTMLRRLVEVFEQTAADADVRVVVLRGAGEAFCAGLDLKEMQDARATSGTLTLTDIEDVFRAVERLPQPTIAMVQGEAIAGGCELALHCDLRVASDEARFAMPLARLGIVISFPLVVKLVDSIGMAATKELLFTGEFFAADRAISLHMVNRVVPRAELEATGYRLAETIAANAPLSVRALKRTVQRAMAFREGTDVHDLVEEAARVAGSEDVTEGVRAMREKRPPRFRGR